MTILVAFDGLELSAAALHRAHEYGAAVDERVVAVTVVPNDRNFAVEYGWIDDGEEFSFDRVTDNVRELATDVAPGVECRFEPTSRNPAAGMIASKIRRVARELDPEVVFVGSDDAGGVVTPISSVGGSLSGAGDYDVFIVRHPIDWGEMGP